MSAMSDAVNNGPRAASAKTAAIEARIVLADAKASALRQSANNHARRAKGDGPMAKYHRGRAAALAIAADRRRAEAADLRVGLAKAKADEAARHAKHVKRTVASTAASGLVPKAAGQVAKPGRAKAGQVAKPAGRVAKPAGQRDPWGDPPATGETVREAVAQPAPKTGREPVRPRSRKETCRWWSHDHGRCPRDPHPDSKDHLCDSHHYRRYGVTPTDTPTKGTQVMTVSGEAVNIEQTRANLDQLKGQVSDLRGSFEGISGSLASGGLNQLAGSLASADDSLDSVLTQIAAAEKHLSDQEAIAEAAQAAGEMHGDKSFYGA